MGIRTLLSSAALSALVLSAMPASSGAAPASSEPNGTTTFNVFLPLTNTAALDQLLQQQTDSSSPNYHHWLTVAEFKQQFGPSPATFAAARAALEQAGLTVIAEHTQNLTVQGSVQAVEKLFATQLTGVKTRKGNVKLAAAAHGKLNLPSSLAALGAVIPEFAPHLAAQVHSRVLTRAGSLGTLTSGGTGTPHDRLANADSLFYPNDLNEAYQLPSFRAETRPLLGLRPVQLAGVGATIGIVIDSVIDPADLAASFDSTVSLGTVSDVQDFSTVSNLAEPTVTVHTVNGGSGAFDPNGDSGEASLDTQMSLGTAPGAKEILYDMPDLTDADIMAAYAQLDEENLVDVVSSSFGECELDYTAAANDGVDFTSILKQYHALFQQGNAQGITFLASSGDSGAPLCLPPAFASNPTLPGTSFVLGVSTPADDPDVTAVGGTNLQSTASPTANDVSYLSENADFDPELPAQLQDNEGNIYTINNATWGSGGGFSQIFSKPFYQLLVDTGSARQRAVPDVSLMMGGCPSSADLTKQDCTTLPRSAVVVWIGGAPFLLIGTSASSPEMAGVLALAVERAGTRLGNANPLIYALSAAQTAAGGANAPEPLQYFHRNVSGNNNGYTVRPGQAFSEVLGNGTLHVKNFLSVQGVASAGAPGTASNP